MKGCLRFLYFHILNMAIYLAKFIYGPLPLEQHHKIEKKKKKLAWGVYWGYKNEPKKIGTT